MEMTDMKKILLLLNAGLVLLSVQYLPHRAHTPAAVHAVAAIADTLVAPLHAESTVAILDGEVGGGSPYDYWWVGAYNSSHALVGQACVVLNDYLASENPNEYDVPWSAFDPDLTAAPSSHVAIEGC
jgi:hypothetical protein